MEKELVQKIAALAGEVVKKAMASGLTWDESIAAFGVASKALAVKASSEGCGTHAECTAHAQKRFQQGIDQTAQVLKTWLN